MNTKHKELSDIEKSQLATMIDECGYTPILRMLGQHIAHCAADSAKGNHWRSELCRIALEVQEMPTRF